MTLHNRAAYLPEAVDSLLAQSFADFTLVLVDDGSTDESETLGRRLAERDARVTYVRLPDRRGMVAAWREAFEHATAGGATYFAWASDHDRWHPEWLETLVGTLAQHPAVVLAYPLTQRIDPGGQPLAKPARQFETFGMRERGARWRLFNRSDAVAAGDMVYGLMRASAVREAGVFREVLCPDRLLLAELTLRGEIRQVPEVLWYRRQFSVGSIERQRSTLFRAGHAAAVAVDAAVVHACAVAVDELRARAACGAATAGRRRAPPDRGLCAVLCVAPLWQVERAARNSVGPRLAALGI